MSTLHILKKIYLVSMLSTVFTMSNAWQHTIINTTHYDLDFFALTADALGSTMAGLLNPTLIAPIIAAKTAQNITKIPDLIFMKKAPADSTITIETGPFCCFGYLAQSPKTGCQAHFFSGNMCTWQTIKIGYGSGEGKLTISYQNNNGSYQKPAQMIDTDFYTKKDGKSIGVCITPPCSPCEAGKQYAFTPTESLIVGLITLIKNNIKI